MSTRYIEGLVYSEKPGYSRSSCVLCGYPNCRCEGHPERRLRERYKEGAVICGSCWEDGNESEIRRAVSESLAGKRAASRRV